LIKNLTGFNGLPINDDDDQARWFTFWPPGR